MVSQRWIVACVFALLAVPLVGQDEPTEPEPEQAEPAEPSPQPSSTVSAEDLEGVDKGLRTPRATMMTFVDAMQANDLDRALATMDLPESRKEHLRVLSEFTAFRLIQTLDRSVNLRKMPISIQPGVESPYIVFRDGNFRISLTRQESLVWLISRETVESVEAYYQTIAENNVVAYNTGGEVDLPFGLWLQASMPESLNGSFLFLAIWQWLGILILVIVGLGLHKLATFSASRLITRTNALKRFPVDGKYITRGVRPLGYLVQALFWYVSFSWLGITNEILHKLILFALEGFAIFAGVWMIYALVDLIGAVLHRRALESVSKFDDILVPLIRKSLKIIVIVFGVVILLDNLEVDLTALLAAIGGISVALGFAARNLVENFFGSVVILFDKPFSIGDWINVDGVEGTVEDVGVRSTRVRTFYNSLLTIPNAKMLTDTIDNYGARTYRRIYQMLAIKYDTPPDRIQGFCRGIERLIVQHPYTRKDYYHVYLNKFGDSALEVMLYCFVQTPEWGTELRERERLFIDIIKLANDLGVEFAFPTTSVEVFNGGFPAPPAIPEADGDPTAFASNKAAQYSEGHYDESGNREPPVDFNSKLVAPPTDAPNDPEKMGGTDEDGPGR